MSCLLIIGAGGHGQCCHEIAQRMNCFEKISFLDDDERYFLSDIVIGKINDLENFKNEYDSCFVAIGNNKVRKELCLKAKQLGYQFATLIDPMSFVSQYCFVGEGTVVFPGAVLETHCHVDRGCIISSNTTINHDAKVNAYTLIYSNSIVRPRAYIGEMCLIESRCVISSDITVRNNSYIAEGRIVNSDKEYAYEEGVSHV